MEQIKRLVAAGSAGKSDVSGLGHPRLHIFDEVRPLFTATGLSPEPATYELFYLHVSGADPALSREVGRALSAGRLGPEEVTAMRKSHLGDIAAAEIHKLMRDAQGGARKLVDKLENCAVELEMFDNLVSEEDYLLARNPSPQEMAAMIQRLRRANALMMASNRRMDAEISNATLELNKMVERLDDAERAARTDIVTGLLNRSGASEALEVARASALASGESLSIALVDIDHFDRLVDQWGHMIGDEVLRFAGSRLAGLVRALSEKSGFAARRGGEEFLLAFPGATLQEVCSAIDDSRASLARQVLRRENDGTCLGRLSLSAGVSVLRPDDTLETLVDRADAALYAARKAGRDRVLPESAR